MSQENNDTTKPIAEDMAVILKTVLKQVEKNQDVLLTMALNLGTLAEEIKKNKRELDINQVLLATLLNLDNNDYTSLLKYAKSHERLKQH